MITTLLREAVVPNGLLPQPVGPVRRYGRGTRQVVAVPVFGATAFAFIDHLAEVGVVGDGIVLLVVMHIFCRTTWNVVKKQFGGKVLAVDVEGHVYLNYFSLKRFVVKPYVGLV